MPHNHDGAKNAWVVDVNMGYGHSRPAHSLRDLCGGSVLSANDYEGIPDRDKNLWRRMREMYETVSRYKRVPIVGQAAFAIMDRMQLIPEFYPRRDLSESNLQLRQIYALIEHGFGKHLIEKLSEDPRPLVCTFFTPAFMADYYEYPNEIYCLTTDADISRTWVPLKPKESRINYFASNGRVVERLKLYGVPADKIHLTGFPLPKELIGGQDSVLLKDLLAERLCQLDPKGIFHDRYKTALEEELGPKLCKFVPSERILNVTYAIGGAGAQHALGIQLMKTFKRMLREKRMRLNLITGTRPQVYQEYLAAAKELGLESIVGDELRIYTAETRLAYFNAFVEILKSTDILWTKPSELSFYTGLGIPVIMTEPIGSQEEFNRVWLQYVGGGIPQADPRYADEWLFDWVSSGGMARMAWNGYIEAPTHGTYRIEDTVRGQPSEIRPLPFIV